MVDMIEINMTARLMDQIRIRWIAIDKKLTERLRTINYTQPETIKINSLTTMTVMWKKGSQSCIFFSVSDEKGASTVKTVEINTLIEAAEPLQEIISQLNSNIQTLKDRANATVEVLDKIGAELSMKDEDKTKTYVPYIQKEPDGPINDKSPIENLDIDVRIYNALTKKNIRTVGDLCKLTEAQFSGIRDLGRISRERVKAALAKHNRSFTAVPMIENEEN